MFLRAPGGEGEALLKLSLFEARVGCRLFGKAYVNSEGVSDMKCSAHRRYRRAEKIALHRLQKTRESEVDIFVMHRMTDWDIW